MPHCALSSLKPFEFVQYDMVFYLFRGESVIHQELNPYQTLMIPMLYVNKVAARVQGLPQFLKK